MKPKLTPLFDVINTLMALLTVCIMLRYAFTYSVPAGILAIFLMKPVLAVSKRLLDSQFDTTSQEEKTENITDDAKKTETCTHQTKENDTTL